MSAFYLKRNQHTLLAVDLAREKGKSILHKRLINEKTKKNITDLFKKGKQDLFTIIFSQ